MKALGVFVMQVVVIVLSGAMLSVAWSCVPSL